MRASLLMAVILATSAQAFDLDSGTQRATTVELFTSEGCSSCPPADQWLAGLKSAPSLFDTLIPMAFHVDYWDRLGWQDPFASSEFSQRQRRHHQQGNVARVYTPGFVVDNLEWRGFFRRDRLPVAPQERAGRLQIGADYENRRLSYQYRPTFSVAEARVLHTAYLMMGVCNKIDAGENNGRLLCHDFVVTRHRQHAMERALNSGHFRGQVTVPAPPDGDQRRTAFVAWVSWKGQTAIEQAVAAYLPADRP